MHDPTECRARAKCCLELADSAPSLIEKLRYEGLAHTWLRLANDLEQANALVEHWGDPRFRKTG